jgi:hypothetical protein
MAIADFVKDFLGLFASTSKLKAGQQGQQRPISSGFGYSAGTPHSRYYDQEIPSLSACRDSQRARKLHEARSQCSVIATAINQLCDDSLAHYSGDGGIFCSDYTDRNRENPIDQKTKAIINDFLYSLATPANLRPWVDEYLSTGDCFVELRFDSRFTRIEGFLHLPAWELFRIENDRGLLSGYEQRRHLQDSRAVVFDPLQIIHFRYQRRRLYGVALFEECLADWEGLKQAEDDWARASRELAVNPLVHKMPDCSPDGYKDDYQEAHKERMRQGTINHYYLDHGGEISDASSMAPSLAELAKRVEQKQRQLVQRARIPPWLIGMSQQGAKEVAGLPGESYGRHVNMVRQALTDGLAFAIEVQLALAGIYGDQARFRLEYPTLIVNPYALSAAQNLHKKQEDSDAKDD